MFFGVILFFSSSVVQGRGNSKYVDPQKPPTGSLGVEMMIGIPATDLGAGFVGTLAADYIPFHYTKLSLSFGMASAPEGATVPGNVVATVWGGICTMSGRERFGACIAIEAAPAISLLELDEEGRQAAYLGVYNQMSMAQFLPNSFVLATKVRVQLLLDSMFVEGWAGPNLGWSIFETPEYAENEYLGALVYGASVGTGGGDLRGGFGFHLGFSGLRRWTGPESHTYCLDGGIGFRVARPYFDVDLLVRIPIGGPSARIDATFLLMVDWHKYRW